MRKLITYPVGLVLKTYMAYAHILVARDKKRTQRADTIVKKQPLAAAYAK